MLQDNKVAQAKLMAEKIIKADWLIECLDLLSLYTESIGDNALLLEKQKTCPEDLNDAVCAVIYAESRTDIDEFSIMSKVFQNKYGKEFVDMAREDRVKRVNGDLVHKLSGQRPNAFLVASYMKEIAHHYGVNWTPDEVTKAQGERFDSSMPIGATTGGVGASGLGAGAYTVTDGRILPPGQKPRGYVPPTPPTNGELIEGNNNSSDSSKGSGNDNDNNNDNDTGGDIPVAAPVNEAAGVPHHAVRKNEEKPKTKAKAKSDTKPSPPKTKPEKDLDDLQKRFARLQKM